MGVCCCRPAASRNSTDDESNVNTCDFIRGGNSSQSPSNLRLSFINGSFLSGGNGPSVAPRNTVDQLILELLSTIRTLVEVEQDPPPSMLRLHIIADKEQGWLLVIQSMISVVPIDDPLGPAGIIMLLDDCPLPTKDSILKMTEMLNLKSSSFKSVKHAAKHRNICLVLGCLADKLAGPNSIFLMTNGILDYLLANVTNAYDPSVVLFSLIALEKFAQTSENKITIMKRFKAMTEHPLVKLESWAVADNYVKKQVGFCATWSLDNICKYLARNSHCYLNYKSMLKYFQCHLSKSIDIEFVLLILFHFLFLFLFFFLFSFFSFLFILPLHPFSSSFLFQS